MKKLILFASAVALMMTYSCSKEQLVPEGDKPDWLGESIYGELENPQSLTGTFKTYMRLVDDLGYKEVLSKTGSKTIFPANDEAFARFFASGGNEWGVTSYEQLTLAQKKVLLYNSMLDNAMLLSMLPNVSSGSTSVSYGEAVKHMSNASVIDTVTAMYLSTIPQNNKYWDKYKAKGINVVMDNTRPMVVHLTREYMINNNITTSGDGSDFEIITGQKYDEDNASAYIFNDKVVKGDVTCQNGYIHQVENVLEAPGNMGQILRKTDNAKYWSRICDYYSAPYYDLTTTNSYNQWALQNGKSIIDSIFQIRYISKRSQEGKALTTDPNGSIRSSEREALKYDLGWNGYYPNVAQPGSRDVTLIDVGAMFVPIDDALWEYFSPNGNGGFIMDIYGDKPNTRENFEENLDSLKSKKVQVLTSMVNNLMESSFASSVPSKFYTLTNDASENLGMKLDYLVKKDDGSYDIKIGNNGVIYMINKLLPPDELSAVLAPASLYPDMQVMNWCIQDQTVNGDASTCILGLDFKYYLLAMSANYALFLPDDAAFNNYYIDPTSMGHTQPLAIKFTYDGSATSKANQIKAEYHAYNPTTGEVDPNVYNNQTGSAKDVKTLLADILNTHTVLLDNGETFGTNNYYMTKSGAGIYVGSAEEGGEVGCGLQVDGPVAKSKIKTIYNQANGKAFRIDRPISPTVNSVYATLNPEGKINGDGRFEDFFNICALFSQSSLLEWAGISATVDDKTGKSPQDAYTVFVNKNGIDQNIRFFNSYNYTLYAPNQDAMKAAYAMGLPSVNDIYSIYNKYQEGTEIEDDDPQLLADKEEVVEMLKVLRQFVRYHFQTQSIFADNEISEGDYSSLRTNEVGVPTKISVTGGNGILNVKDAAGVTRTVNAKSSLKSNMMTRDFEFDKDASVATSINTSSFAVVHEISEPLCYETSGRYHTAWDYSAARANYAKKARVKKANSIK